MQNWSLFVSYFQMAVDEARGNEAVISASGRHGATTDVKLREGTFLTVFKRHIANINSYLTYVSLPLDGVFALFKLRNLAVRLVNANAIWV